MENSAELKEIIKEALREFFLEEYPDLDEIIDYVRDEMLDAEAFEEALEDGGIDLEEFERQIAGGLATTMKLKK